MTKIGQNNPFFYTVLYSIHLMPTFDPKHMRIMGNALKNNRYTCWELAIGNLRIELCHGQKISILIYLPLELSRRSLWQANNAISPEQKVFIEVSTMKN